jgi:hypothetical protein
VDVGPDRVQAAVAALDRLDVARRDQVYWAGRLTLCGSPDDIDRYDRAFAAYFGTWLRSQVLATDDARQRRPMQRSHGVDLLAEGDDREVPQLSAAASPAEVLRHRDISSMSREDRAAMYRLLQAFRVVGDVRRTRRSDPAHAGAVDGHRTLRRLMRSGGEPALLARRTRRKRARRVVVLVDVSGSMSRYADALLRFSHAASHRDRRPATEIFTVGTRLTRVTRELSHRDPDLAFAALAAAVPDWSGGTRLGLLLKAFLDEWGQRGMARGAVVVLLSDGWEQGDVTVLGEQMGRLHRLAHRVVWANPRAGLPGFEPLVAGMNAALPYVDDFVAGHSLAALEHLATVVAGARVGDRRSPVSG